MGLTNDVLRNAHKKFIPAKITFLIILSKYQAVSSDHKTSVESP